ncbi:L,D-transpeptidase [Skermania sp. ID1734]|uniref:L,D-transpeptidase n=1 Tax=Skermania sp. ID1734 TaxID=2597516 RepID=UPI0011804015|nr:L,D-transpeptidase [Skermania sp. ID1734]TSE00290.1 L,D-transpeptidase [Skermania sp. ID1734]
MAASRIRRAALGFAVAAAAGMVLATPAVAEPLWPGGPDIPGVPAIIPAPPAGQPPVVPFPQSNIQAPGIAPGNGEVVGGKRAVDIHFRGPVTDRTAAENSVQVTSSNNVAGHFQWVNDSFLQWVPNDYWPRGTSVTVNADGNSSHFNVSNSFTGVADAAAHTFTVKVGDDVVRTFPASLGKPGHASPNGTFPVLEKDRTVIMDSSTYGVPVNSPQGYRVKVDYATRLTWDGVYVHAAPWSVDDQGHRNVSHGCINLSTDNAKWYFDNVQVGDQVTIQNA